MARNGKKRHNFSINHKTNKKPNIDGKSNSKNNNLYDNPNTSTPNRNNSTFFSNIASTAVGVGIGSMVGNWFFYNTIMHDRRLSNSNNTDQTDRPILCGKEFEKFGTCLEENKSDIGKCQIYYDTIIKCADDE